jgi:hypothetical protein
MYVHIYIHVWLSVDKVNSMGEEIVWDNSYSLHTSNEAYYYKNHTL